jgi:HEAT repeat protein
MADPQFQQQLEALGSGDVSPAGLQFLTDLTREQKAQFREVWNTLPLERRQQVAQQLVELAELSVELDFDRVFQVALDDEDDQVRATAIEGLWENESVSLLRRLLEFLEHDRSPLVQTAVMRSLARYALRAVNGQLDEEWPERLKAVLLRFADDGRASVEVRRRAVEAVAVFPDDEAVQASIAAAYADRRRSMRASALYAMGRNLDERWLDTVLDELGSAEPILRFEAARASGELGSQRAVPILIDLLDDPDREAQLAAVAALGKLGGRTAGTALRKLLQSDDEVLRDAAEEALDELNFGSNPLIIG